VGVGSIGRRHCRNLAALGADVLAWDADPARLGDVAASERVKAVDSLDTGLAARPDAALICTPPASHVALARRALDAGADLFVEKPIAHATDGVLDLLADAARREKLVMVGCNLRFLPSLRHVQWLLADRRVGRVLSARANFGSYLPDWRPGQSYRDNYAVSAAQGGGVLLDAIHELDYLGWLFGPAVDVSCAMYHVSALAGDTEDLVEATVTFGGGIVAQVHLDYFRRTYRRDLEVIGDGGTIRWDFPTHSVTVEVPGADADRRDFSAEEGDPNAMYVAEVRHFLDCLGTRRSPIGDGAEGFAALRLAMAARASARDECRVTPVGGGRS